MRVNKYISKENIIALLTANSNFRITDSKIVVVSVNMIDSFRIFLSCSLILYRFSVILNTERDESSSISLALMNIIQNIFLK